MVKRNKFINKLFGKDLTDVMYTMLEDFIKLDYDEDQIEAQRRKEIDEMFRTEGALDIISGNSLTKKSDVL